MRRVVPWLAVTLLLATNAIVLLGVWRNRQGDPEAVLVLTEREVPAVAAGRENTGLSLKVVWHPPYAARERGPSPPAEPDWLGVEKLTALGFDCRVPPDDPNAATHYRKALPLERYAVLELEGASWQAWLTAESEAIARLRVEATRDPDGARWLESRERQFAIDRRSRSRLMLVDVGSDPVELRRRYPDRRRTTVVPAVVRLTLDHTWNARGERVGPPRVRGYVAGLLVSDIHVPHSLRPPLEALGPGALRGAAWRFTGEPADAPRPRYEVTVSYGRRLEPWLTAIRLIETGHGQADRSAR